MKSFLYSCIVLVINTLALEAQDLKKHQWENRIIVVSSPTFDNDKASKQLARLQQHTLGLKDRKLVVYHRTNTGYSEDFGEQVYRIDPRDVAISSFKVELIGLDGTEKFRSHKVQEAAIFFGRIDAMPMRKAEIRNKRDE